MTAFRFILGIALIAAGLVCGIYAAVSFVSAGIADLRAGRVVPGLFQLLVLAELAGVLTTAALVVPGVWVLPSLSQPEQSRES
jgi:hypothetical protein